MAGGREGEEREGGGRGRLQIEEGVDPVSGAPEIVERSFLPSQVHIRDYSSKRTSRCSDGVLGFNHGDLKAKFQAQLFTQVQTLFEPGRL